MTSEEKLREYLKRVTLDLHDSQAHQHHHHQRQLEAEAEGEKKAEDQIEVIA